MAVESGIGRASSELTTPPASAGPPPPAGAHRELLARCTFPPPPAPVTCAVSGGADSLALLVLATATGCPVTAVHVDHGLRPGSEAESEVVDDAARRLGAGFRAERVTVAPGPNLEARARAARYSVLPPDVLTGHTADDQAETVLLNLLRGAGLDGMAGMAPAGHPILGLRRAETLALVASCGLTPVDDPTNSDPEFRRNRVRAEVLPLLESVAQRDVAAVLVRQAGLLREEAELLDDLARALDPTDAAALAGAPVALARRALRRWLTEGREHPPGAAAVERVLDVARGRCRSAEIGAGRRVSRSAGRLRLEGG